MTYPDYKPAFSLLLLITPHEEEQRVNKLFKALHMPIFYQCYGSGTATSEIMDLCGLTGTRRLLTFSMIQKKDAAAVQAYASQALLFHKKGKGIAIMLPLSGMQKSICQIINETPLRVQKGEPTMNETPYSLILTVANSTHAHEVMEAARRAGAKGGTLIKGRHQGSKEAFHYLQMTLQQEQEMFFILVPQAKKMAVMTAIAQTCGLNTPAQATVFSLPVDDVFGLEE